MTLKEMWHDSRAALENKTILQVVNWADDGRLSDGAKSSQELRDYLALVPSSYLRTYAEQCLSTSFPDSGFALQDIINEIGRRLGYDVTPGRYRGTHSKPGHDGLWRLPDGHAILLEVKTTADAFVIDLDTVANYRRDLIRTSEIDEQSSSILIVVGRSNTRTLEEQIRGSRQAWDVRLISVDALCRLMLLKEDLEDPEIINRIHSILVPKEFTKLDSIVEVLFSTAEDVKEDDLEEEVTEDTSQADHKPKFHPVAFNDDCVERIQNHLKVALVKRSKASFSSPDGLVGLVCAASRRHGQGSQQGFWFGFHPHQKDFLDKFAKPFVAFGCGSSDTIFLIPFSQFKPWLERMNVTRTEKRTYWHVQIAADSEKFTLVRKKGTPKVDLTPYLLPHKRKPRT